MTAQLFQQALNRHEAGDLNAAGDLYRAVLKADPNHADAWYLLGFVDLQRGDHRSAVERFDRALALRPRFADAHLNRASALAELGDLEGAMAGWRTALSVKPDIAVAHANLGATLWKLGRIPEALPHLLAHAEADKDADMVFEMALTAAKHHLLPLACQAAEATLRLRPNDAHAYVFLSMQLFAMKRFADAEAAARQAIDLAPRSADAHGALGHALFGQWRNAEAGEAFAAALIAAPDRDDFRHYHAIVAGTEDEAAKLVYARDIFDAHADTFDRLLVEGLGYQTPQIVADELTAAGAFDVTRPVRIVDLGCGTGLCGVALKPQAAFLVGLDISPRMVAQTKARGIYDEALESDLVPYLDAHAASFDVAVAGDVLVYVGGLSKLFAAVRSALVPGGWYTFSIETTDKADVLGLPTGRFAHNPDYIRTLAAQAGFTVVRERSAVLRKDGDSHIDGLVFTLRAT